MRCGGIEIDPDKVVYTEHGFVRLLGRKYYVVQDDSSDGDELEAMLAAERSLANCPGFVPWAYDNVLNLRYVSGYERIADDHIDVFMDTGEVLRLYGEQVGDFIEAFNARLKR